MVLPRGSWSIEALEGLTVRMPTIGAGLSWPEEDASSLGDALSMTCADGCFAAAVLSEDESLDGCVSKGFMDMVQREREGAPRAFCCRTPPFIGR
jgi:hypothetical protein